MERDEDTAGRQSRLTRLDCWMQERFDRLSEKCERFISAWWGFLLIVVSYCGAAIWDFWTGQDRYATVIGFWVALLLVGQARRNGKATHAKLDAVTPGHDLDRLEERSEREMEEVREHGRSGSDQAGAR